MRTKRQGIQPGRGQRTSRHSERFWRRLVFGHLNWKAALGTPVRHLLLEFADG